MASTYGIVSTVQLHVVSFPYTIPNAASQEAAKNCSFLLLTQVSLTWKFSA